MTIVLWVIGSAGFSIYVKGFSHYGALYGVFSTAVVLLVWLYLMAMAFLYGAELDGELRRRRAAREASSEQRALGALGERRGLGITGRGPRGQLVRLRAEAAPARAGRAQAGPRLR